MGDENETQSRLSQRGTETFDTRDQTSAPDTAAAADTAFSTGLVLGGRYRVEAFLGQGGMGEVWRALDVKLRVDVALKSISEKLKRRSHGLEYLRREVRAARSVNSPNVCRIHDLLDVDGLELVSMEYVDGETLVERLRACGPMDLHQAGQFAAQFLGGLESIHEAGLVHRDLKPENVMITRSGRVVIMDLGLAKAIVDAGRGTIAGTVPYMPPEQLAGKPVGPEADIFAAGVLLAELVDPRGVRDSQNRQAIREGIRDDPPTLSDTPWRTALAKAVAPRPADRYPTARAFSRALEEVVLRVHEADGETPYLGLASFTEDDADFFFGREAEVEALWKKLSQANLLAVIGASGAGKSSFVRAGVIPASPDGWGYVICKPRADPFVSLAQALVIQFAGNDDVLQKILQFDNLDVAEKIVAGWRERHAEAVIIIDQFEELFTLNPPNVQARFAELIGRISTGTSDTHVLLVSRDDFLIRCHALRHLAPLFSDLTPLGPPTGEALRRAVVQPALRCGYHFENESLLEEILGAVADERAPLPLLAFALTRLWELRDKKSGVLTRQAYEEIGGVSGALAQHAEATLEWIGPARGPVVRELLRNLVTAQGTRVAREVDELLTLFSDSETDQEAASDALSQLVDARLLTTFDAPSGATEDAIATPTCRDRSRVVVVLLASLGTLADPGCGRSTASRRTAPDRRAVGQSRATRRPPLDRLLADIVRALA